MKTIDAASYPISIFMAGDIAAAIDYARRYCDEQGLCVTVSQTTYVYTGGQESGFVIGLINYPRFRSSPQELWATAEHIAAYLRERLHQDSYTIQTPDKTVWFSHREEDAKSSPTA